MGQENNETTNSTLDFKRVGNNLLILRLSKRLTLFELEKELNINNKTLSHYETGRKINVLHLSKICNFYKVLVDDVLYKEAIVKVAFES